MTETTTGYTPTDGDVERAAEALWSRDRERESPMWVEWQNATGPLRAVYHNTARDFLLATIGPIVERERRAAKVEALREAVDRLGRTCATLEEEGSNDAAAAVGWSQLILTHRADDLERGE